MVWIAYLDCRLPRRLGRKLSHSHCVDSPSLDEVLEACKRLGLVCEEDRDAKYPRAWYASIGRVFVETDLPKLKLLKMLAEEIRRIRRT